MRSRTEARSTRYLAGIGILTLVLAAGCKGNSSPTTPDPSTTPTLATDTFTGTLAVKGSDTKTFTVNYALGASSASVTVMSLKSVASSADVSTTIGVGIGTFAFDGSCALSTTLKADAATVGQQLTAPNVFSYGNYCVQIYDSGTLTEPVTYTMDVSHY